MYAGRPHDSVRCVSTAAALVALVHNEEKAEKLIRSILTISQFKKLEAEINEEFTKGKNSFLVDTKRYLGKVEIISDLDYKFYKN